MIGFPAGSPHSISRGNSARAPGRRVWVLLAALLLGCSGGTDAQEFAPFGTVSLTVDFDVDGQGFNVDSIAFFEAPDPNETLMFVTAKSGDLLEVWQYPFVGNELTPLMHPAFGDSDTNGVVVDRATSRLHVTVPASESTTTPAPSASVGIALSPRRVWAAERPASRGVAYPTARSHRADSSR